MKFYDEALSIDPNHVPALLGKSNTFVNLGDVDEAMEYNDKVLALDPNNGMALSFKQAVESGTISSKDCERCKDSDEDNDDN